LGVPKDSKSPTLEVLGFTPTLGQSRVATKSIRIKAHLNIPIMYTWDTKKLRNKKSFQKD
jgi:hypothetical protein